MALASGTIVEELAAPVPYARSDYSGDGWPDTDSDCQSDRHEILIDESLTTPELSEDGCFVESGTWFDWFTGDTYSHASDATIDHFVPLAAAHRAGAWAWDEESKRRLATDIDFAASHAVVGEEVNQAKGDKEPHRWRPPAVEAHCAYAVDWIAVKVRWELAFSADEVESLDDMLDSCDPEPGVASWEIEGAAPQTSSTTTTTTTTTTTESTSGPAVVELVSCNARSERVVITNSGGEAISLSGWLLHDEGRKHEFGLAGIELTPGERVAILTGEGADPDEGEVLWKQQNVWNNDGDEAFILQAGALVDSVRC